MIITMQTMRRFITGSEYLFYTFKMEGDPFFGTGIYGDGSVNFVEGWVSYNGRKYGFVALLFDLVRDQLVVLSPDQKIDRNA